MNIPPPAHVTPSRRGVIVLLVLASIAAFFGACGDASWREVRAPDGGFRILMRGDPRVEQRDLDTPVGRITGNWYALEEKNLLYGVGYADYPEAVVQATPPQKMFAIVREGWLRRIEGKLVGDGSEIKLDNKWNGMEFSARGRLDGREAWMRGRFYLVDNRLYQLVIFGSTESIPTADMKKFMDSFKVSQPREVATVRINPAPEGKK